MSCFYKINRELIKKRLKTKIFYDKNGSILCVCRSEDNSEKLDNIMKFSIFCNSKINKTKSIKDLNKLIVNDSFEKTSKESSIPDIKDDSDIFIDLGDGYDLSYE
tara:strand:+ start:1253 stop:1567 length:315 start_codon:yes stop_codon:yes gene_type:complete